MKNQENQQKKGNNLLKPGISSGGPKNSPASCKEGKLGMDMMGVGGTWAGVFTKNQEKIYIIGINFNLQHKKRGKTSPEKCGL